MIIVYNYHRIMLSVFLIRLIKRIEMSKAMFVLIFILLTKCVMIILRMSAVEYIVDKMLDVQLLRNVLTIH